MKRAAIMCEETRWERTLCSRGGELTSHRRRETQERLRLQHKVAKERAPSGRPIVRAPNRRVGLEERHAPTHEPTQARDAANNVIEGSYRGEGADAGAIGGEQCSRHHAHLAKAGRREAATDLPRREWAVMLVTLAGPPANVAVGPAPRHESHAPYADVRLREPRIAIHRSKVHRSAGPE